MVSDEQKQSILGLCNQYMLGVLATVDEQNRPEAALVGFAETKELEIIFGCSNTARKYKNLQTNPHVAFVIGGQDSRTIQYEGTAREVTGDEREKYVAVHVKKKPSFEKYAKLPDNRYFAVTPSWIRYLDLHQPEDSFEIEF